MSALVIRGCYILEALLAGGVPYLQLANLSVNFDCVELEVDADALGRGGESVIDQSKQKRGFAHILIADQEYLEQMVAIEKRRSE